MNDPADRKQQQIENPHGGNSVHAGRGIGGLVVGGGALLVGMLSTIRITANIKKSKAKELSQDRLRGSDEEDKCEARGGDAMDHEKEGLLCLLASDVKHSSEKTQHGVTDAAISTDEDSKIPLQTINNDGFQNQIQASSIDKDEDVKVQFQTEETMEEHVEEQVYETCVDESDKKSELLTHIDAPLLRSSLLGIKNAKEEIEEDDDPACFLLAKDGSPCNGNGCEIHESESSDNGPVFECEDSEKEVIVDPLSKTINHSKQEEIISLNYSDLGMLCSSVESSNGVVWPRSLCHSGNRNDEDAASDRTTEPECIELVKDGGDGSTEQLVGERNGTAAGNPPGIAMTIFECVDPNLMALSIGGFLLVVIIQIFIYFAL